MYHEPSNMKNGVIHAGYHNLLCISCGGREVMHQKDLRFEEDCIFIYL